jgi:hypothetical protein
MAAKRAITDGTEDVYFLTHIQTIVPALTTLLENY